MITDVVGDGLRRRVAHLGGGDVEGLIPGLQQCLLVGRRGHPVLAPRVVRRDLPVEGPGVPLPPEPHQPLGDERQTRVAVVDGTEGGDEAGEHPHDPRVVVVGADRDTGVVGAGAPGVDGVVGRPVAVHRVRAGDDALVEKVAGQGAGPPRKVEVEAQHHLVPAGGDGVEALLHHRPVVGLRAGHDVRHRQGHPLHGDRRGVLRPGGITRGVIGRVGHQTLERVGHRRVGGRHLDPVVAGRTGRDGHERQHQHEEHGDAGGARRQARSHRRRESHGRTAGWAGRPASQR